MPRRGATITQADVARTLRAAKQAGASNVEVRPDGTIIINLRDKEGQLPGERRIEHRREIVL